MGRVGVQGRPGGDGLVAAPPVAKAQGGDRPPDRVVVLRRRVEGLGWWGGRDGRDVRGEGFGGEGLGVMGGVGGLRQVGERWAMVRRRGGDGGMVSTSIPTMTR